MEGVAILLNYFPRRGQTNFSFENNLGSGLGQYFLKVFYYKWFRIYHVRFKVLTLRQEKVGGALAFAMIHVTSEETNKLFKRDINIEFYAVLWYY